MNKLIGPNGELADATYEIEYGYIDTAYRCMVSMYSGLEMDSFEVINVLTEVIAKTHDCEPEEIYLLKYRLVAKYNHN